MHVDSKSYFVTGCRRSGLRRKGVTSPCDFYRHFPADRSNVVESGFGTINTSAMAPQDIDSPEQATVGGFANENIGGPLNGLANVFSSSATGPTKFGTGSVQLFPTSRSGDLIGIFSGVDFVLPVGYLSGGPLFDTDTYANSTLSSLGITPGTYTYSFGSGASADTYVITAVAPVPEPASLGVIGIPAPVALLCRRRNAR